MALVRWDPFREVSFLRNEINRLFEDSFRGRGDGEAFAAWSPAVDIYETDNDIVIHAELPGMELKDIDIQVSGNLLTIKGEKRAVKDVKEENVHRTERVYGIFQRTFTLPETVAREKVNAAYKDGVLTLSLPKVPETKPTKIAVKAG